MSAARIPGSPLLRLERALARGLAADLCRRGGRLARRRALARFARRHPRWHASFFDASFVASSAAAAALRERDPGGLARAWTEQFRYRDPHRRARDAARLEPVARAFLALLEEEEARLGLGAGPAPARLVPAGC